MWEKRKVPRFRGADYGICRWRYFLSVKKVTKERRVFAVGAPARRSRDGNGKIAVRGGEAMAAKRTTAQGGFAQRNAARDFARQTQKAGPVTGQPGFAAGEMRPNGSKGRGNGSRVWEKEEGLRFRGADYESPTAYFSIKKAGKKVRGVRYAKKLNFKFHNKLIFFTLSLRGPRPPNGK